MGEGGGKISEVMIDEVEGNFLPQVNYVTAGRAHLSPPATGAATPIGVDHSYPPFNYNHPSIISMSLFLLSLLLYPVIASPAGSFRSQATFAHDNQSEKPGWYDPRERGGQFLDVSEAYLKRYLSGLTSTKYTTKKYGEPLNIIISGHSDPFILSDTGLHSYAKCASVGKNPSR